MGGTATSCHNTEFGHSVMDPYASVDADVGANVIYNEDKRARTTDERARPAPADGGPVSVASQTTVLSPVVAQQSNCCFLTDSSPLRVE
jgi:hypothetical protein